MTAIAADSFHIAATHPDACALQAAAFIDSISTPDERHHNQETRR
jgi:hypothetical protein